MSVTHVTSAIDAETNDTISGERVVAITSRYAVLLLNLALLRDVILASQEISIDI
jgi:hypothetical protein